MNAEMPAWSRVLFEEHWRHIAIHGGRGSSKSHSVARALLIRASQKTLRILCAREIQDSIKKSVKQLLDDCIESMGLRWFFTSTDSEIRGQNGSLFIFAGLLRNIDSVKSMEGVDICWVEEAQSVSQRSIDVLVPTIRKTGSQLIWVWNPTHNTDPVDRMFRTGQRMPDECVLEVNYKDNPWFTGELRAEMERDKRRDPDRYRHVWCGEYVSMLSGCWILRYVEVCPRSEGKWYDEGKRYHGWHIYRDDTGGERLVISVDPAAGDGGDSSAIVVLSLLTGQIVATWMSSTTSLPDFIEVIKDAADRWNPTTIIVESNGVGTGLYQDLKKTAKHHVTEQRSGDEKHLRLQNLKMAIEQGVLSIGPELVAEVKQSRLIPPKDSRSKPHYEGRDDCLNALSFAREYYLDALPNAEVVDLVAKLDPYTQIHTQMLPNMKKKKARW